MSKHDEGQAAHDSTALATRGEVSMETASSAQAASAQAMVQARFTMAFRRKRNIDDVRVELLKDCQRPGFAAVARYCRPVGKVKNDATGEWEQSFAEGPSIRFAEAAARAMGNIDYGSMTIFDDAEKRVVRVFALDLESNTGGMKDITISKTKERRFLSQGEVALTTRRNSYGDLLHIVAMKESELPVKEAAETSKALRVLLLRLVPGWILDECEAQIFATQSQKDAADPDAARHAMVDQFAKIGVKAADLVAYLRHDLSGVSPAELLRLRAILVTIRDGEATWAQVSELSAVGDEKPKDTALAKVAEKVQASARKIQDKAKAKDAASAPPAAAPAAAPPRSIDDAEPPPDAKLSGREPGSDG